MAVGLNYLSLRPFWRTDLPEKSLPFRTLFRRLTLSLYDVKYLGDWWMKFGRKCSLTEVQFWHSPGGDGEELEQRDELLWNFFRIEYEIDWLSHYSATAIFPHFCRWCESFWFERWVHDIVIARENSFLRNGTKFVSWRFSVSTHW
jgi:hypothetical protein